MSLSQRARDKLAQEQRDASQSGGIPLLGFGALAFMVAAIVRLIL